MAKLASVFILLLCVNIIGYVLLSDFVGSENMSANGNFSTMRADLLNNPLMRLYDTAEDPSGNAIVGVGQNSSIFVTVPTAPSEGFFSGVFTFIDRILVLFGWVRAILGIALFPVTLLSMLLIPWQLSLLLAVPLATVYIMGIIDLFSGGGT